MLFLYQCNELMKDKTVVLLKFLNLLKEHILCDHDITQIL